MSSRPASPAADCCGSHARKAPSRYAGLGRRPYLDTRNLVCQDVGTQKGVLRQGAAVCLSRTADRKGICPTGAALPERPSWQSRDSRHERTFPGTSSLLRGGSLAVRQPPQLAPRTDHGARQLPRRADLPARHRRARRSPRRRAEQARRTGWWRPAYASRPAAAGCAAGRPRPGTSGCYGHAPGTQRSTRTDSATARTSSRPLTCGDAMSG